MSTGKGVDEINPVFEEEDFWYILDVDYEEAKKDVKDEDEEGITTIQDALLNRFITRKTKIITRDGSQFDSVEEFEEEVKKSDDAKELLRKIYVEYLWAQNNNGDVFETDEGSIEHIETISDTDNILRREISENLYLLWPGNSTIEKEIDQEKGEVNARKYLEANPTILKKREDGKFEVRGRQTARNKVSKRLREDEDISEEEPEKEEKSIVEKVGNLINRHEEFKLIGVEFDSSSLPENSEISIENERPIYADVEALEDKDVVSLDTMSQISKIHLKDTIHGAKFKVTVKHSPEGFKLELEAAKKLDENRERFRNGFEEITGIEFGTVYDYASQDQRYLFNMILSGEDEAYKKYYDKIDSNLQEFIDDVLDVDEEAERKLCMSCRTKCETDVEECSECGLKAFADPDTYTVVNEVDDSEVCSNVAEKIGKEKPEHSDIDVVDWNVELREMGSRDVIETEPKAVQSEGRASTSRHHRIFFVPIGNGRKPGKVDDYLLESVFITYGDSESRDYRNYGRLSVYDLLASEEEKKSLVGNAIKDSIIGLRDRTLSKSTEAQEEARDYFDLVDELGPIHEHKEELKQIYNHETEKSTGYFEKKVFYLFKGIFLQTERWGEEFESEPDGMLPIPNHSDEAGDYSISIYDAKLSHAKKGYDIDKSEEDKASRYILTEDAKERIQNRTGDEGLTAHIFVSQNFDGGGFETRSKNILENVNEYGDGDSPSIVFMEYESLVDLYELTRSHWRLLGDARVREKFHQYVKGELESGVGETYTHFNEDSLRNIREDLLDRVDSIDDSRVSHSSG